MKKMWWLSLLLALPFASASPLDVIGGVWNKILMIGSISFLQGAGLVGFTRILIWILVFALFFAVMTGLKDQAPFKFFGRSQAMIIAAVLATISAIFLPAAAILAVGAGWATAIGLILIGAPLLGLGYVLWNIPGKDQQGNSLPDTRGTVLLKLLVSMLLFWVLSAMNYSLQAERGLNIGSASVAGTMANFIAWALYIVSIMIIYYIVKFFLVGRNNEEADRKWKEGGEALQKSIGKKMEAQKAKEEMERRAREVREPHSYLVDAVEECKKLVYALARGSRPEARPDAVQKAEKSLKSLRKVLKKALRSLRHLRRKERGQERARYYDIFDKLHTSAGVALEHVKDISLPKEKADDQQWRTSYNETVGNINVVAGLCGQMINALNAFIEHANLEAAQQAASQHVEQQAQERAQQQEQRQQAAQRAQEQVRAQEPQRRRVLKSKPTAVVRRRK